MRYNKLDLNLLVTLDVLLSERSISRSAEQLNLSPSSISHSLTRLREYFDDELLVQVGRRMEPTPRAESLRHAVRDVLLQIDSRIATKPVFDPQESERTFRIYASDYAQLVFAPTLLSLAAEARSKVRFLFTPFFSTPARELERGDLDLLLIPRAFSSPDEPQQELFTDEFVCLIWAKSQLARGELDLERYVAAEHAVMKPPNDALSFESLSLQRLNIERRIGVTTYSFTALPGLVVGTERIATVHARLAHRLIHAWPLEMRPTPCPIEPMVQTMQWHRYRDKDPGLMWLRELAAKAGSRL
jgi:LysR family transcriptional regulator, nod-box dependent transcriptional activator